jgi:hypothetical protein
MKSNFRTPSWIVGIASLALPAAYFAYQQHAFQLSARSQEGPTCGMPILAFLFIGMLGSASLSALATLLNGLDLQQQPAPRTLSRYVELVLLSIPMVVGSMLMAVAILS